jgi:succinate dehydrogenase / fumarate reductase membrane anchor subunit
MAVTTGKPGSGSKEPPTTKPKILGGGPSRPRPSGGMELWMWLFMRVSAILLLFLAVGHVLIMHVVGGGVGRVNFGFVATRWRSPFWRTWDWLLLSLALLHGINGLRVITMDYVSSKGWRAAVNTFWFVIGVVLFALGTMIIVTFNPATFHP